MASMVRQYKSLADKEKQEEMVQALALVPILIALGNPPDLTPLIFSIYVLVLVFGNKGEPQSTGSLALAHHKKLLVVNALFAGLITTCLAQINTCLESPNYLYDMLGQKDFVAAMLVTAICAVGMAVTLLLFRPARLAGAGVFVAGGAGGAAAFAIGLSSIAIDPALIVKIFLILGAINALALATAYGGSPDTQKTSTAWIYLGLAACQGLVVYALISVCRTYVHG